MPPAADVHGAAPASPRVLVVDPDARVRAHVREVLAAAGFDVTGTGVGGEALDLALSGQVDILVTELALPDMSGFQLCRTLRSSSQLPLVVLTALRDEVDKVLALEVGADDYVTKPWSDRELALRLRAVLRRSAARAEPAPGAAEPLLSLDPALQAVTVGGRRIGLSPAEFRLLELLQRRPGAVVPSAQLVGDLWGGDARAGTRALVAQVRRLRKKIEDRPEQPTLLLTVRGRGYRLGG